MLSAGCLALGLVAPLFASAVMDTAAAQKYARGGKTYGYVVAESRFGWGSIRGAVRQTSLGRQVQLPGGAWTYCERSCSETLRARTVDFWEAQRSVGGREQGLSIYLRRW